MSETSVSLRECLEYLEKRGGKLHKTVGLFRIFKMSDGKRISVEVVDCRVSRDQFDDIRRWYP